MLDGEHEHSLTMQRDSLESTTAAAGRDQMATTAAATASAAKLLATLQQLQLSQAFARRTLVQQLPGLLQNEGT